MRITKMGERGGLAPAVAQFAMQRKGFIEAGDSLLLTAQCMIRISETVQRMRLAATVAEVAVEGASFIAVCDGQAMVPEQRMAPADAI